MPFGVLILVVGTLMVMNFWAVIDTKMALNAAARQAAHAVAEAPDGGSAQIEAEAGAEEALVAFGSAARPETVRVNAVEYRDAEDRPVGFQRCARVRVVLEGSAPLVRLPLIGAMGTSVPVSATGVSIVDPYRLSVSTPGSC